MAFQSGALSQAQIAYQEQIAAFASKLETARSAQADLNHRVMCLTQRDADLVKQRGDLEKRLGRLITEENDLTPKVRTLEAAYKQFKKNFEAEQKKVTDIRKAIENMPGRERYEKHKRDCASKNAWDRVACGRRERAFLPLAGRVAKYEADLKDARRREQIALDSMNAEKKNFDESERQLKTTRGQLDSARLEVRQTETAIGNVSKALKDTREVTQPLQIAIDDFANALNEAKEANLEDQRPRALRKLAGIAAGVDAAMQSGRTAVTQADRTLGAGWMKSCKSV
jgi:chromosome segregation ATPase